MSREVEGKRREGKEKGKGKEWKSIKEMKREQ